MEHLEEVTLHLHPEGDVDSRTHFNVQHRVLHYEQVNQKVEVMHTVTVSS